MDLEIYYFDLWEISLSLFKDTLWSGHITQDYEIGSSSSASPLIVECDTEKAGSYTKSSYEGV